MRVYSFDPGKRTGFAVWDLIDKPSPFSMPEKIGVLSKFQLYQFLTDIRDNIDAEFIFEDYRINNHSYQGGFNHQGNSGDTLRIIGAIEYRAWTLQIPIHPQQRDKRASGAGFAGLSHDSKKHDKDEVSAMKHGYYYMVKNQLMRPRG